MESRHNLKYWRLEPYLGFGDDAHSFDGQRRWSKDEQSQAAATEHFFVGLRLTEGVRPNLEEWQRVREPIGRFVGEGLMEADAGWLRLTPRGILLSNEVFQEFLEEEEEEEQEISRR